MIDDDKIISEAVNSLIEKPKYEFTIDVSWHPEPTPTPKRTLWDWITRKPLPEPPPEPEKERTFKIIPCKVANMYRIASRAVLLPNEITAGTKSEVYLPLIHQYMGDVIYIVAAGIQNNHLEPDPELITFIERNFDAIDLYSCLNPVLENVNMEDFFDTIVLIKGTVTILKPKTSPADGSE